MINSEEFKKRVTVERFDNLVRTAGESPAEVGELVLRTAQNSVKAFCIRFGGRARTAGSQSGNQFLSFNIFAIISGSL